MNNFLQSKNPLVSFVIASNRIDEFLKDSLDSVFLQTYKNIEVIFVANGVDCESIHDYVVSKYKKNNLIVLKTKIPQLAFALNMGIDYASGEVIARMDADDICLPHRIEAQIAYMKENDVDILGSSVELIDEKSNKIKTVFSLDKKKIKKLIYFKSPIFHPSVVYKKKSILNIKGYNSGFNSEDYDLWLRAERYGLKIDNVSEVLLKYRIHSQSSQKKGLGYAEVAGYSIREFLLTKKIRAFISIPINFIKYFLFKKD